MVDARERVNFRVGTTIVATVYSPGDRAYPDSRFYRVESIGRTAVPYLSRLSEVVIEGDTRKVIVPGDRMDHPATSMVWSESRSMFIPSDMTDVGLEFGIEVEEAKKWRVYMTNG